MEDFTQSLLAMISRWLDWSRAELKNGIVTSARSVAHILTCQRRVSMSVLTDAPAEVLLRVHWDLTALGAQKEHSLPSQMVESVHSEIAE